MQLSGNKYYSEREAYNLLSLLGDFGGFNDAIFMIFGFFMSFSETVLFTFFMFFYQKTSK